MTTPTPDREALLALADRCEKAEGADRALDAEIAAACRYFPRDVGFVWEAGLRANVPEVGRIECHTNLGTGGPHYAAPKFTTSLDAAMTLVPSGSGMKLERYWIASADGPVWSASVTSPTTRPNVIVGCDYNEAFDCRSAALALTAASLRAMVALAGDRP